MGIKFRLEPIHNNIPGNSKKGFYPVLQKGKTVTMKQVAKQIAAQSSFTSGDVKGVLDNLSNVIAFFLETGNNVHLEGLGTFSLSVGLKGQNSLPEKITGKSIKVRHLNFRTTPEMLNRLNDTDFEKL